MKVALISLGCAKNLVDSEHMLAKLNEEGIALVEDANQADVVVINTCGFIEAAKQEAIEQILGVVSLKEEGIVRGIVVTGCLTQRYRQDFIEDLPEVDAILGTGSYHEIIEAVKKAYEGQHFEAFAEINEAPLSGERLLATESHTAYLKIAEGCDNLCAYCIIPSLRGRYRSRPIEEIMQEAQTLADQGVKEIIVIAQDITRYGTDLYQKRMLPELTKRLCKLPFHWVRLHYLYPDEIEDELIDAIASEPKVTNYLDIPLQHASDRILTAMNRRGDKAYLTALIQKLRERIDGVVLRTSLIVGLPGETDEEFTELCDFLRETGIERAGVFAYSPEEGTVAYGMENQVDEETKQRRVLALEDIQSRILDAYNASKIGKKLEVLCESYDGEQYVGRTYADSPGVDANVYFTAPNKIEIGTFVSVTIQDSREENLVGIVE